MIFKFKGCEFNGVCKAVNETWQSPTDKCTNYVCLSDIADDGTPIAYVQKDQGKLEVYSHPK